MTIQSGFFNSINGDRKYDATWFAQYFASFIGNGVFPNPSTGFKVVEGENMNVIVKAGKGWINGYYIINDNDYVLTIDNADGVLKRIDRVVMRLNYLTRQIEVDVKKGEFASNPVAPTLQRDADAYELALADILINNGVLQILQANITDTRLNNDLCGIVHGVVDQVDTTEIFNQYQSWFNTTKTNAEIEFRDFQISVENSVQQWMAQEQQDFETWFATLEDILDENVAATLVAKVTSLEQRSSDYEYQLGTVVERQLRLTRLSDIKRIPFNLTDELVEGAAISVSLDNGTSSLPLLDVEGNAVTSLPKGFGEVVASDNFFTLVNKGGSLTNQQLQALIDIVNELTANDSQLRQSFITSVIAANPDIPLNSNSTWNDILLQIPNIRLPYFLDGTANFNNSRIYTMLDNTTVNFYYISVYCPFKPSRYILNYTYTDTGNSQRGMVVYNADADNVGNTDTIQRFSGLNNNYATNITFRNFKAQSETTAFYDNGTLRIPINAAAGTCTFALYAYS